MNSILVYPEEIREDGTALLRGDRAIYAREWHELVVGARVRAMIFKGRRGHAEVEVVKPNEVILKLDCSGQAPPRFPIHVICAVPRPQTVRKVLQAASTLGVLSVNFIRAEKVVKSYLDSKALREEYIQHEIWRGLEQAYDPLPPVVSIHHRFRPFLEDELPGMISEVAGKWLGLLADTRGQEFMEACRADFDAKQYFLGIGPESGWNEFEREAFEELGFHTFTLGSRMLRVETALTSALGQVELLQRLQG